MGGSDYVKQEAVPDFRSAWEEMDESTELADSYGLGQRDSMQEAVEAVIAILGMQVAPPPSLHLLCLATCVAVFGEDPLPALYLAVNLIACCYGKCTYSYALKYAMAHKPLGGYS